MLSQFGKVAKDVIREAGGVPFEFNTIGVDDGIAMEKAKAHWNALFISKQRTYS